MFIAALFTIAKIWKQPKCPSADEWIKKLRVDLKTSHHTHTHTQTHTHTLPMCKLYLSTAQKKSMVDEMIKVWKIGR